MRDPLILGRMFGRRSPGILGGHVYPVANPDYDTHAGNFQALERVPIRRAIPGHSERQEFEYARHGTVNILVFLAVHTGLQSEYFVSRQDAVEVILAIERLRDRVVPHLMISELRTVDADRLWLSPCYRRPSWHSPDSHRFSFDTGMRPVSNACSSDPGAVPDDADNEHPGNPG